MASPPYNQKYTSAISPPYPSSASLPQPPKRRQTDMPSSAPAIKRRKASMLSTTSASSHPLRQTSFPPEQSSHTPRFSRSPSMDTVSLISGSAAGGSKKRKRKSKGAGANDDASTAGRKPKSADGRGKRRASREQTAEEEEEDDQDGEGMAVDMGATTQEEKQKELERRAMLSRAFDPDQFMRYEAWRSSRLPESTVRRIVNQTLSQSAPASVILAVRSVAKIFAGDLIEEARKVQTQWLEATGESQTGIPSPPAEGDGPKEKETRRGPLLPDHLRESIRRYKAEGDDGLVGHLGLWQLQAQSGVERFGVKLGGKRLMK